MGPQLRKLAGLAGDFERVARLFESLMAQSELPDDCSLELARLHGDWAQAELTAGQTATPRSPICAPPTSGIQNWPTSPCG